MFLVQQLSVRAQLIALVAVLLCSQANTVKAENMLSLSVSDRKDQLDWNIAGSYWGGSPNVLSELTWRDMGFTQVKAELTGHAASQLYYRASLATGWVQDGENQDSDYAGDNRTLEFSRTINGVGDSSVWDISAGIGSAQRFGQEDQHTVVPMIGYSIHQQDLRMTDANQVVSNTPLAQTLDPSLVVPPLGPFAGLDSSYQTEWRGFWFGLDVNWDMDKYGFAFLRMEYHKIDFTAEANWNLRSDFAHPVSFEHIANGAGQVLELGWRIPLNRLKWGLGVSVSRQTWQTDAGVDTTYFADSSIGITRVNEVNWTSKSINVILSRMFMM